MKPAALLIHVPSIKTGLEWYQLAFPSAQTIYVKEFDFSILDIDGFSIEVVQADSKVAAGKKGTVMYWAVDSLTAEIKRFESLGASLYRGPLAIENNLSMCQIQDPFGNLIGLRGKLDQDHLEM